MKNRLRYLSLLLPILFTPILGQNAGPCTTDYGHDYVSLRTYDSSSVDLYAAPTKNRKPWACLRAGFSEVVRNKQISKVSLVYKDRDFTEDISDKMVEVFETSEYALPIEDFSPDSLWVKVSLDSQRPTDPPVAWLNAADARKGRVRISSWDRFFKRDWTVIFLCDTMMAFFEDTCDTFRIFPKLVGDSTHPDYWMRVIKTSGNWMQVYLESPIRWNDQESNRSRSLSESRNPRFWIRYLNKRGQPRIWYFRE